MDQSAEIKTSGKKFVPEKIKNRLYPVVLDRFSKHDFHQVNLKEVSESSGVSTATIYKYFDSKENLVFAVLEEHMEFMVNQMKIHIQGIESTREKWRKLFWVILNHYDTTPGLAVTFFITVPTKTWMEEPDWPRFDIQEISRPIISEGKEKGDLDLSLRESQILAQFFMHLRRAVQVWYYHRMQWNLADSIDRFFPVFWKTVSS